LPEILKKIDCQIVKHNVFDIWYHSPFRSEKTASFHVSAVKNVWYDFGEAKGGNVIDFVCAYLKSYGEDDTLVDALRWLDNMMMSPPSTVLFFPREKSSKACVTLWLHKEVYDLEHPGLVDYLESRGIPLLLAKKYLKEALVRNAYTDRKFYAISFRNEGNGYELRNKFFKGCISPKSISFIRGTKVPAEEIHVFEGFMDFLSALSYQRGNRFEGDVIILNSLICLAQALPYIKNYTYKMLYSWLDNDEAGQKATKALKEFAAKEKNLTFKSMNETYAPHKDVNAWHMHKLEL
jgi:hypothetical protein